MTCPLLSTTGAWGWTVRKNCRGSAVAVLRWSSISLSWCRGRFPTVLVTIEFPQLLRGYGGRCPFGAVLGGYWQARCSCDDRSLCWSRQCRDSSRFHSRSSGQCCWYAVGVQKLWRLRSYSSPTSLVHVPVVIQRLVPMVQTAQFGLEAWTLIFWTMSSGYFLGPCTGTGQGVVSTGTRPP